MNEGMIFWMILFGIFAAAFFGVAAVVAVTGWRDVRDLLTRTPTRERDHDRNQSTFRP